MSQVIINIVASPFFHKDRGVNQDTTLVQAFTAATFAAVAVPAGSIGVMIIPDNSNVGTITLKGVTGDTGVNLRKSKPSYLSLDEAAASFGLLCASTISVTFIFV